MLWDAGDCYRCRCKLKPNSLIYILQLKIIHFPSCMSVGQRVGPGRRFLSVFEVCSPSNVSLYTGLLPFRHSFCSCPRTLPALSCSLRLAHKASGGYSIRSIASYPFISDAVAKASISWSPSQLRSNRSCSGSAKVFPSF